MFVVQPDSRGRVLDPWAKRAKAAGESSSMNNIKTLVAQQGFTGHRREKLNEALAKRFIAPDVNGGGVLGVCSYF